MCLCSVLWPRAWNFRLQDYVVNLVVGNICGVIREVYLIGGGEVA